MATARLVRSNQWIRPFPGCKVSLAGIIVRRGAGPGENDKTSEKRQAQSLAESGLRVFEISAYSYDKSDAGDYCGECSKVAREGSSIFRSG